VAIAQSPAGEVLDPIITMNASGVIQSASDSVEQVFGWTPAELFGLNVKVLIPEPRRSSLDRYLDRYRQSDKAKVLQRTRRFDAVRKDGKIIQIEMSMSRADVPAYGEPYFIGIVRDVNQQIDTGLDPAGQRTRLNHLIVEQTRALAEAHLRLQLADRLASLGTLAAGLGHDMNNILLPVRAHLSALDADGVSAKGAGHITAVRNSVEYLQHLSDGLHFVVQGAGDADSDKAKPASTYLAEWWSQVGVLLKSALPSRVKFRATIPPELPVVGIAPHWLTQAVLNLLVNAGEAFPASKQRAAVRLLAQVSQDHRFVALSVTDNGRGMSRATSERVFDLFYTTKPRSMGTGLGLPLTRKMVQRAGGSIEIESRVGRGTTFTLHLPVLPVVAGAQKVASSSSADTTTVALSIKNHRAITLLTQIITGAGAQVARSRNGGPGKARVWVTEPTARALGMAQRWKKKNTDRNIVLFGVPPKAAAKRWNALGATVIASTIDFPAMRRVLGAATRETPIAVPDGEHR
jgi:PAS domain S-box-containing protein